MMNAKVFVLMRSLIVVGLLAAMAVQGQQHYATRLGNPATRFADPLQTPEDLRRLFASEKLRADVEFIAKECGYQGDFEDLRRAAANSRILELSIPTKTLLPAMSTREHGKPVLLREVLWKGKEPIPAYEFYFVSGGRRYRVVTPKPCANFWVEDYGKVRLPTLTMQCRATVEAPVRRPIEVCFTITNSGDESEAAMALRMAFPEAASFVSATGNGQAAEREVAWEIPGLRPGRSTNVCAVFTAAQPAALAFVGTARGRVAPPVESHCETRVVGVPGVLIEVVDLVDPIEVGNEETYEILVLNQGSAVLTNVKFVCTLEENQEFVSGSGASAVAAEGRIITLAPLPHLQPKEKAVWRVVVRASKAADARFTAELTADQFQQLITETESTQQY